MKKNSLFDRGSKNTGDVLVLTNWLDAVARLYTNYKILLFLQQSKAGLPPLHSQSQYIGQCPISRINRLSLQFNEQLAILLEDLGDINGMTQSAEAQSNYHFLANHTQFLVDLNRQAQELLLLTTLSNE